LHLPESEPLWRAGRGFVVRRLIMESNAVHF
jgi:predicted metal-dependent HD superfamily phosphohydrolase